MCIILYISACAPPKNTGWSPFPFSSPHQSFALLFLFFVRLLQMWLENTFKCFCILFPLLFKFNEMWFCVPSMMFSYVHDWSRGLFCSPEVRQSLRSGSAASKGRTLCWCLHDSLYFKQLLLVNDPETWEYVKKKLPEENIKFYHLTAKQKPKTQAGGKEGLANFRFTKKLSCDHFPSKSAGVTGHIMFGSAFRAGLGVVPALWVRDPGNWETLSAQKKAKRCLLLER